MQELDLTITQSGLLVSAWFFPFAAMQIPGGYLADRWGGEKTVAIFTLITGISSLAFSQANTFEMALISRILIGLSAGSLLPAAFRSLTKRLSGHQLELANGIFVAGWGLSSAITLNLIPITTIEIGWRSSLTIVAIITLIVSAYAWITAFSFKPIKTIKTDKNNSRREKIFTRSLILFTLINTIAIAVPVSILTWAPMQLQIAFGVSFVDAGRIVSIIGILGILGSVVGGVIAKNVGRRRLIIISMGLTIISLVSMAIVKDLAIATISIGILAFAITVHIAPLFSMLPYSTPSGISRPGLVFGMFNMFSNIGAFFPPLLLGIIIDYTGNFTYAFVGLASIASIGLISALLFKEPKVE